MIFFPFSKFLLGHTRSGTFVGLQNCRMAAYFAQMGRCYVTDWLLQPGRRQLHHRDPRQYGGPDTPANTILLDIRIHRLVHSSDFYEIDALLEELALTEPQLHLVNQLRAEARMFILKKTPQPVSLAA